MKVSFLFLATALLPGVSSTSLDSFCLKNQDMGDNTYLRFDMTPEELNTIPEDDDGPDIEPIYDPLGDGFCFNEAYNPAHKSKSEMLEMYDDFEKLFYWGFVNRMGSPLQSESELNNHVTNNRFPGMYLRMCFHDNSVNPHFPDFQDYIKDSMMDTDGTWKGVSKYLDTSGADASHLMCKEERLHPNNNYDKTASRVLYSMQVSGVINGGKSLKEKYGLSYADLLHNGCIAATIFLTNQEPEHVLELNPMKFGRHDACFVDQCGRKNELCGPTGLLPGVGLTANQFNQWFSSRGMSECLWMSTMWTHTTMDNMAAGCPLHNLPCSSCNDDVTRFIQGGTSPFYFKSGDKLDYFSFFLQPGSHTPSSSSSSGCSWHVDGKSKSWPLTKADCTLGVDNVEKSGEIALANAIKNFHKPEYVTEDILLCALNILGGAGDAEGGICDTIIPSECQSKGDHKFGAVYDTVSYTPPYTQNLIENGSFELPYVDEIDNEYFYDDRDVPGWKSLDGKRIEYWCGGYRVNPSDGRQLIQLDTYSFHTDGIYQDIQTEYGKQYTLMFDIHAYGPSASSSSNSIVVEWNGHKTDHHGYNPTSSNGWTTHTITVTGTGGIVRLLFRESTSLFSSDAQGPLLDNIILLG